MEPYFIYSEGGVASRWVLNLYGGCVVHIQIELAIPECSLIAFGYHNEILEKIYSKNVRTMIALRGQYIVHVLTEVLT